MALPLIDLADILRGAGCEVVEYPGWRTRGRPGTFTPRGAMVHHDGSPLGPAHDAEVYARFLFEGGRPTEGIPAPLTQTWIDFYGRWWLGAAGRANHAGLGTGWGAIGADLGNPLTFGIEMDNTIGEPTTADQYEALHRGLPAVFTAYGWDAADALTAHKEYARGRKSDPDDIDMPQLRRDVIDLSTRPLPAASLPPLTVLEDAMATIYVKGDQAPDVYALDTTTGLRRHVEEPEYAVATAAGVSVVTVAQGHLDALPKTPGGR